MIQRTSPAQGVAPSRVWRALWVLLLLCSAFPARADGADVAIMPFDRRQLDATLTEALLDTFQIGFAQASGLSVIGQSDIVALVGLEKQKELAGCDTGSCVAELGGALGVRFMVVGRFAKVGNSYLLLVKMIDVTRGGVVAQDQETVSAGDEQRLLEGVQKLAARFGKLVSTKVQPMAVAAPARKTGPGAATPPPAADKPTAAKEAEGEPASGAGEKSATPKKSGTQQWAIMAGVNAVFAALGSSCCLGFGVLGLAAGALSQVNAVVALLLGLGAGACGCISCVSCLALGVGIPVNIWLYTKRAKPVDNVSDDEGDDDTKDSGKATTDADADQKPADQKPAAAAESTTPATTQAKP